MKHGKPLLCASCGGNDWALYQSNDRIILAGLCQRCHSTFTTVIDRDEINQMVDALGAYKVNDIEP